jgi:two-component system, chemotaxis family, chemotaxis protein CheY
MTMKVLIVDDSNLNRMAIKSYFTQLNYNIIGLAESVEDAKKIYEESKPDIVTIDQIMPGQNGVTLAKYINERDVTNNRKTTILFITADPLRDVTKSSIKVDSYILKPVTKEKIAEALSGNA